MKAYNDPCPRCNANLIRSRDERERGCCDECHAKPVPKRKLTRMQELVLLSEMMRPPLKGLR